MTFKTLLTTDQMYQADALTIAAGMAGFKLMENAGNAVAEEILGRWQPRPLVVLCGPGNNGGDGFVVARRLADAGWPVRLALLGNKSALSGDAARAAAAWSGPVEPLSLDILEANPLVVDALFGAGLDRALTGDALKLVEYINENDLDCVAIDVPSGVRGNSGQILGNAPRCRLTVTFFRAKPAHYLVPAKAYVGDLCVADIGISSSVLDEINPHNFVNSPSQWGQEFPQPELTAHKFSRGHVLIAGGYEMTGAARLAARAARRVGSGLVTIACDPSVWPIYATDQPGLLIKKTPSLKVFHDLCQEPRTTAIVIGPGFGRGQRTRDWVLKALSTQKPIVLDADALSAFEDQPEVLINGLHDHCVLTPHAGEFARLFDIGEGRLETVKKAALQTGACVLLKGPDTIVANPSGWACINSTGTPYLATAGSGDVLAGLIGGLLAQGMVPTKAASAAVWMHGVAAEIFGPGLIAEDLPGLIPEITSTIIKMSSPNP